MARRIVRALVKPDILVWARENAGFDLDEVASSQGLSKVGEWERGDTRPTINQLRSLAKKYRRPLAVFYLQEKPADFQVISDFRRRPSEGMQRMSAQLRLQIRSAQERREAALDLLSVIDEPAPEITISATLDDKPEDAGALVRSYLQITEDEQREWTDMGNAFNAWRKAIENAGALVFQMDKIDTGEASGFAISKKILPVITVNRRDEYSRRIFSLLHEFAHLLLAESGVSEFRINVERPPEVQEIEVWCNAVAAAALIPSSMFFRDRVVRFHESGVLNWTDNEIVGLSKAFSVSRSSIVRRLLTLELTDKEFYDQKEEEYAKSYANYLEKKKAQNKNKDFRGRNMRQEAVSLLGRNYIRLVLAPYHSDRITLRDVSEYLNLRTRHIPEVEKFILDESVR